MNSCQQQQLVLGPLLFQWPIKKTPRISLPLCILLAALLHISAIYLFDIVYQAPHVNKPVTAQVLFLLPGSPISQQFSIWLQANDSSIFSPLKTTEAARPKISPHIYQPRQLPLPLRSLPPLEHEPMAPPSLPVNESALPSTTFHVSDTKLLSSEKTPPTSTSVTTIRLLENLASRAPASSISLGYPQLPNSITTPLPPTELTINIDTMGIPRHAIIIQSSGNADADEAATHWLMTRRFAPATEETWGNLLVLWGKATLVNKDAGDRR
ncbi:MAG: hypothetical protein ACH346_04060 [Chthoniobacterales bacterium]